MLFCLADGTKLVPATVPYVPQPTAILPPAPATDPGPTVASPQPAVRPPAQSTMVAPPQLVGVNPQSYSSAAPGYGPPERARASVLPWLLGIAVVLGLSGIVIALILARSLGGRDQPVVQSSTPAASPTRSADSPPRSETSPTPEERESPKPSPEVKESPKATPTKSPKRPPRVIDEPGTVVVTRPSPKDSPPERAKPMFAVFNNTSMDGSRITYYPRPSFGTCQADCAANASCKGFTWIRPGAYNPGDSAMCYIMASVTNKVSHPCCISAVRN